MQLPILRWAPVWREPGALRADAMAALTGAIVVLPQGVAFDAAWPDRRLLGPASALLMRRWAR